MDAYTPTLLEHGLRIMIGKGERSPEVQAAVKQHQALYLVATGGVAAYLSTHVTKFELFLWPELGAEAIYKMEVVDFPATSLYRNPKSHSADTPLYNIP